MGSKRRMKNTLKHTQAPVLDGTPAAMRLEIQRLRNHIYSLYKFTGGTWNRQSICYDPDCDGLCGMETDTIHVPSLKEPSENLTSEQLTPRPHE